MTESSAPWNGILVGDATTAPYDAAEWAAIWKDLIRGSKADSGPLLGSGTSPDPGLTVSITSPLSATVNVSAGSALVNGTWYHNTATVNLAIGANASGFTRIDTVILRKNTATQTVRLAVLPGTPAASPVPPVLTQTAGLWEIPLADISCANGFVNVIATMITQRRHWANLADGVYLHDILNNSAETLQTGDVVIWDTGADNAVTTLTVSGDIRKVAGVWVGRTPAGGYGRMLVKGVGLVRVGGGFARNTLLAPLNTSKEATSFDVYPWNQALSHRFAIGITLEAAAAHTLCRTYIDVEAHRQSAVAVSAAAFVVGTTNSAVYANVDAADAVSIITHTGRVKVTAGCTARFGAGTGVGYWTIYSDSLAVNAGDLTELSILDVADELSIYPIHIVAIFTGLDITLTQTFHLQHRAIVGGGTTLVTDVPMYMYAEEL